MVLPKLATGLSLSEALDVRIGATNAGGVDVSKLEPIASAALNLRNLCPVMTLSAFLNSDRMPPNLGWRHQSLIPTMDRY